MQKLILLFSFLCFSVTVFAQETKIPETQLRDLGDKQIIIGTAGLNTKALLEADLIDINGGTFDGQSVEQALESINGAAGAVQSLTYDTGTQVLGISGGNTITINPDDADADATNELQNAENVDVTAGSFNGQTVTAALDALQAANAADLDGDVNNEIQALTRTANDAVLDLSGGTVSIADIKTKQVFDVVSASPTLTLTGTPNTTYDVEIYRNSVIQNVALSGIATDVTLGGQTLTFNFRDLEVGERVTVKYISQ